MTVFVTGDTIRVQGTFRNWAAIDNQGSGDLIDPDVVEFNIYNPDFSLLQNIPDGDPGIIRVSKGVYAYDWTLPIVPGNYYAEFKGVYNDAGALEVKPCILREKIKVKFS